MILDQGTRDTRAHAAWLAGDWAISQAATLLGHDADAADLLARSKQWVTLLDPATGFFRTKDAQGSFADTFDEFAWGPGRALPARATAAPVPAFNNVRRGRVS